MMRGDGADLKLFDNFRSECASRVNALLSRSCPPEKRDTKREFSSSFKSQNGWMDEDTASAAFFAYHSIHVVRELFFRLKNGYEKHTVRAWDGENQ